MKKNRISRALDCQKNANYSIVSFEMAETGSKRVFGEEATFFHIPACCPNECPPQVQKLSQMFIRTLSSEGGVKLFLIRSQRPV